MFNKAGLGSGVGPAGAEDTEVGRLAGGRARWMGRPLGKQGAGASGEGLRRWRRQDWALGWRGASGGRAWWRRQDWAWGRSQRRGGPEVEDAGLGLRLGASEGGEGLVEDARTGLGAGPAEGTGLVEEAGLGSGLGQGWGGASRGEAGLFRGGLLPCSHPCEVGLNAALPTAPGAQSGRTAPELFGLMDTTLEEVFHGCRRRTSRGRQ